RQVYQRVDNPVARCSLVTQTKPQTCNLSLKEAGSYILRARSSDADGRVVYASQERYALGEGRIGWRDDAENARLQLVANKQRYRVGDTARVLVKSPFARAQALVTVERAGVMQQRRVVLTGATPTIEVPITDAMRPSAYVGVHLIKERAEDAAAAQSGDELYRIGYAEVALDASDRVLSVEVTPAKRTVQPRDMIVADVNVRDFAGKGKPAEVTFYAVDEGVLALTGYQLPDPVHRFTAPRALRVATIESRADL